MVRRRPDVGEVAPPMALAELRSEGAAMPRLRWTEAAAMACLVALFTLMGLGGTRIGGLFAPLLGGLSVGGFMSDLATGVLLAGAVWANAALIRLLPFRG